MTISNYEALKSWFYGNSRKGAPAPYWTLYGQAFGGKDTIVTRNDTRENLDESYAWLEDSIRRVNNPEGQRFRVSQVDAPGGNNPVGQVFVQIVSGAQQMAGIGAVGYPYQPNIGKDDIAALMAEERRKWEMERKIEDLESRVNAPAEDMIERTMQYVERLSTTPFGAALISKLAGIPIGQILGAAGVGSPDDQDIPQNDNQFYNDIDETSRTLGVTPHYLAAKLKLFATTNPDMAKNLLSTI